jgi:DNA polymerase delta subunit 1
MDRAAILARAGIAGLPPPQLSEDLVLQAVAWHGADLLSSRDSSSSSSSSSSSDEPEDEPAGSTREYVVKAFGVLPCGRAAALTVLGVRPYFYVKDLEGPGGGAAQHSRLRGLGRDCDVVEVSPVSRVDFWGFTNYAPSRFFRIATTTRGGMLKMAKRCAADGMAIYESNVDPLLRFLHAADVQPAGFLRVAACAYARGPGRARMACKPGVMDFHAASAAVRGCASDGLYAPILVAAFDIECSSSHSDFPVAKKGYTKVAAELHERYLRTTRGRTLVEYEAKELIVACVVAAFRGCIRRDELPPATAARAEEAAADVSVAYPKSPARVTAADVLKCAQRAADHLYSELRGRAPSTSRKSRTAHAPTRKITSYLECGADYESDDSDGAPPPSSPVVTRLADVLDANFKHVPLAGDEVIQVGVTFHVHGRDDVCHRHVLTLGSCEAVAGVDVESFATEAELLAAFSRFVARADPDVLLGYNIFGFDWSFMYDRAEECMSPRALAAFCAGLSRLAKPEPVWDFELRRALFMRTQMQASSAMGENLLKYVEVVGRVQVDLMKVVMREHKLDSYRLDAVARHFTGSAKDDVSPADIFRLQRGSAADRAVIAKYCAQDCALCNQLAVKLNVLANNIGMANVCSVPLAFIFLRGQGVKIFSLVARHCARHGFAIPVIDKDAAAGEDGYEGAIVLEPRVGMYLDAPVAVLDYASLYPSSMISENISHDTLVLDDRYRDVPGVAYVDVPYEESRAGRFAQGRPGVLPTILADLLAARKVTRQRMELKRVACADGRELEGRVVAEDALEVTLESIGTSRSVVKIPRASVASIADAQDDFQKAVLDGLQLAYKITANSLYGQMGARTSPLYLKQVAACTTAVGRQMITRGKRFMEANYGAEVIYGDTDSIFVRFPGLAGRDVARCIRLTHEASAEFRKTIKPPHNLEFDKVLSPLILVSKKRYAGIKYEADDGRPGKFTSMGLVLRRRDNAPIVKAIYGGIIERIMRDRALDDAVAFLRGELARLAAGRVALEELVVTKALRTGYANPDTIPHYVLAQRIGARDPGNKPQSNDRVSYVYVVVDAKPGVKLLQGERIETPEFVSARGLPVDYKHYIENQVMKPCLQLLAIDLEGLPGYHNKHLPPSTPQTRAAHEAYWADVMCGLMVDKAGVEADAREALQKKREDAAKKLLFEDVLCGLDNASKGAQSIVNFMKKRGA